MYKYRYVGQSYIQPGYRGRLGWAAVGRRGMARVPKSLSRLFEGAAERSLRKNSFSTCGMVLNRSMSKPLVTMKVSGQVFHESWNMKLLLRES